MKKGIVVFISLLATLSLNGMDRYARDPYVLLLFSTPSDLNTPIQISVQKFDKCLGVVDQLYVPSYVPDDRSLFEDNELYFTPRLSYMYSLLVVSAMEAILIKRKHTEKVTTIPLGHRKKYAIFTTEGEEPSFLSTREKEICLLKPMGKPQKIFSCE